MNDHHLIINIGRQIGSGGREIAQILAERLGCDFYDRRILNIAARESGFDESVFEQIDEKKGLLRSLFHLHTPFVGDDNFYTNNMSQESLFKYEMLQIVTTVSLWDDVPTIYCATILMPLACLLQQTNSNA